MNRLEELHILLEQVKKCDKCCADSSYRWLFPPNQLPEIALISETPGPYCVNIRDRRTKNIWNFWGLVEELFGNRFRPLGDDKTRSTVYWTHYQKCSKMISTKTFGYFGADCADRYLDRELKLVNPKLMIAFGINASHSAGEFFVQRYHLTPLARVECRTGKNKRSAHVKPGTFQTRDNRKYAILCHPSGARRYRGCTVFRNEYEKLIKKTQAAINQLTP